MGVKTFPMRTQRALVAANPLRFGRGRPRCLAIPARQDWTVPDDLRLFATAFAAGFLFVSVLIA